MGLSAFFLLRYGIVAARMKGVALKQSPHGKICALYHTETGNGDIRILGAGGNEPAIFSQMGRNRYLIESNYQQKYFLKKRGNALKHFLLFLPFCPLPFYPDGPFFQTRSAEAVVFYINAAGNGTPHDRLPPHRKHGQ